MPKVWDDTMKRLIRENPQHFVSWLLQGAEYKDTLSVELKNWTRETDFLLAVKHYDQDMLLHLEFQSREDEHMAQRLLEYNVLARREHKRPVCSCVIYLRLDDDIAESPLIWMVPDDVEILRFHFVVIKMWEIRAKEILQAGLVTLLPLLPLTQDGKQRNVVEEMVSGIVAADQPRLLVWAKIFAGLVFKEEKDREWLERRFAMSDDILEESWVVQEWKQRGITQGIREGRIKGEIEGEIKGKIEGKIEGKLEILRPSILKIVELRFPEILDRVRQQMSNTMDLTLLENLLVTVGSAQRSNDVVQALEALNDTDKS